MDSKGKKKNKFNFHQKKDCTIKSLREVNCFLSNLNKAFTIKKLFKWRYFIQYFHLFQFLYHLFLIIELMSFLLN